LAAQKQNKNKAKQSEVKISVKMSLLLDSPLVCQIPDCTTTQSEIEAELASFLASFCSVCKKERAGKLCGCAFPCSLTFRAQMLSKIHELIGIEKPPDRRAIQVKGHF
jgi:hypothetical protein